MAINLAAAQRRERWTLGHSTGGHRRESRPSFRVIAPHHLDLPIAEVNDFPQSIRRDGREHLAHAFDRGPVEEGVQDLEEGHPMAGDANVSIDPFQTFRQH
jgi:hypothetical protein